MRKAARSLCIVLLTFAGSLALGANASAQICTGCLGDIAGTYNPITGTHEPDGLVNQFDLVQLIVIADNSTFEPCADMDANGIITLGPITLNGIFYPGDLPLLEAAFGVCNAVCIASDGDKSRPCTVAHLAGGCNDPVCCGLVCELDPICCDVEWDGHCAATSIEICDNAPGNCLLPHGYPGCNDLVCEQAVCMYDGDGDGDADYEYCCDILWDRNCTTLAGELCIPILCNQIDITNCGDPHGGTGCTDFACEALVCDIAPECCTIVWDESCVAHAELLCYCRLNECGDQFGGSCTLAHDNPGCSDGACCALVCMVDAYCCEIRWDVHCALEATEACPTEFGTCGRQNPNPCRNISPTLSPGCSDFNCCNEVCQLDAYCCAAQWDGTCALLAWEMCTTYDICGTLGTGSCIVEHKTPGCDNAGCCDQVCNIDPLCCQVEWDSTCVAIANFSCNGCGDIASGSCFDINNTSPACNDRACCGMVCVVDRFCCDYIWDEMCVLMAENSCFDPLLYCGSALARSCFTPTTSQGCSDSNCCELICRQFDSFCCEVNWDAVCVTTAFALGECNLPPGTDARGNCLEPHTTPGCGVPSCAAAVCDLDPFCCQVSWTEGCANKAEELCFDLVLCPGEGLCYSTHPEPGCEDPWCCNIVCNYDPACCEVSWDSNCASLAVQNCLSANADNCPCEGGCFLPKDSPGCETEACCTAVCRYDGDGDGEPDYPHCCEAEWDEVCAVLANQLCCAGDACGDLCAGDCLDSNGTPNCDDPACCDAICDIDPYCCSFVWDGHCVSLAEQRCRVGCGVETSGSCFSPGITPGCNDPECCSNICIDIDPICCTLGWDDLCAQLALKECDLPECGVFDTGECCEEHDGPACNNRRCCDDVCTTDPFCCESSWDIVCVSIARESNDCLCSFDCGDPCAGSCCEANGTPSCSDEDCCDAICSIDPFCCLGEWDLYCAQGALTICNGVAGSESDACPSAQCGDPRAGGCCFGNGTPSCANSACCESVCNLDDYCCTVEWDISCAIAAEGFDECGCNQGAYCGDPATGSCDEPHKGPYCSDAACCNAVCLVDPSCCDNIWDQTCVDWAIAYCD